MAIFRFNFTTDFQEKIEYFTNIYKDADLSDFKRYFKEWCADNKNLIENEYIHLVRLGFKGNIIDKIYRSSRYYFMKKTTKKPTERDKTKTKKKYIARDDLFLNKVKKHIESIKERNLNWKPSVAYNNFKLKYSKDINKITMNLINNHGYKSKDAEFKIKKIYKNKYSLSKK